MNRVGLAIIAVGVVTMGLSGVVPLSGVQTGLYTVSYSGQTVNCGSTSYVGQWSFLGLNQYSLDKSVTWSDTVWFEFGNGTQFPVGKLSPTILNSNDCLVGKAVSTIGAQIAANSGGPNPYCTGYPYCSGSATTTSTTASTSTTSTSTTSMTSSDSASSIGSASPPPNYPVFFVGLGLVGTGAFVTFRRRH